MWRKWMNAYATPFTAGLFVVSAVSGVFLFLGWLPRWFHSMHVWLSMVLLLPFVFHVVKNWRAFLGYVNRKVIYIPTLASLVGALAFLVPVLTSPAPPAGAAGPPGLRLARLVDALGSAKVGMLGPALGRTPDDALSALRTRGFTAASPDQTVAEVAQASQVSAEAIVDALRANGTGRRTSQAR